MAKQLFVLTLVAVLVLTSGCATQQGTGGVVGGIIGAVGGALACLGRGGGAAAPVICAVAGATVGGIAGSTVGARLDKADRARADAAAQQALAAREAAVQRAIAARHIAIERQLRAELAAAPSTAARADAEQRAAKAREAAIRIANINEPGPTRSWSGNDHGWAQAFGPVAVKRQTDCEQVREIAVIRGEEVTQYATFCRVPGREGRVRVSV